MRLYTEEEWQQFVNNVKQRADSMSPDAMDYDMIYFFYEKIKKGQIPINKMIRDYGESYFRELIETLKPWSPHYNPRTIQD